MGENAWTYTDKPWPKLPTSKPPEWATFVKGRSPEFKVHSNLGHAKNALTSSGHGICYRWVEDWWHPVAVMNRVMNPGDRKPVSTCNPPEFTSSGFRPTEIIFQYVIQEVP